MHHKIFNKCQTQIICKGVRSRLLRMRSTHFQRAPWSRTFKNLNLSTGPLHCPFTRSLTHSFTHSLARGKVNNYMAIYAGVLLFRTVVHMFYAVHQWKTLSLFLFFLGTSTSHVATPIWVILTLRDQKYSSQVTNENVNIIPLSLSTPYRETPQSRTRLCGNSASPAFFALPHFHYSQVSAITNNSLQGISLTSALRCAFVGYCCTTNEQTFHI